MFTMTRLILKKINMTWTQLRCIGNGNISLQTKYFLLPQLMIFLHTKNKLNNPDSLCLFEFPSFVGFLFQENALQVNILNGSRGTRIYVWA